MANTLPHALAAPVNLSSRYRGMACQASESISSARQKGAAGRAGARGKVPEVPLGHFREPSVENQKSF